MNENGYAFAFAQWVREARSLTYWSDDWSNVRLFMRQQHELLPFRIDEFLDIQARMRNHWE